VNDGSFKYILDATVSVNYALRLTQEFWDSQFGMTEEIILLHYTG